MSSSRRSGLRSVTAFTASNPFEHSAMTSTSSYAERYSRRSLRASSSSSTMAILIFMMRSDTAIVAGLESAFLLDRRPFLHLHYKGSTGASEHSSVRARRPFSLQALDHKDSRRQSAPLH